MLVTVLCGGRSTESEISLRSAQSVVKNLLAMQCTVQVIEISKQGKWFLQSDAKLWLDNSAAGASSVSIDFSGPEPGWQTDAGFYSAGVVFPVLHGKFGEDGAIQGLLETMNVPYVSSSILGSAAATNKAVCKQLLQQANVNVVDYQYFYTNNVLSYQQCSAELGDTLFVKAASGGSSIGVEKVANQDEYDTAVAAIAKIDSGILVEREVKARELECAVIYADNYVASVIGEVSCATGFYDYNAKYTSQDAAQLLVPAAIEPELQLQLQNTAKLACQVLHLDGFARVDFFLEGDKFYINEVNPIPGFTDISLFPRMLAHSGLDYPQLLKTLLDAAIAKHAAAEKLLENTYES